MNTTTEPEYWVRIGAEAAGPFSATQIREMLLNGEIQLATPCAPTGADVWRTVAKVFELQKSEGAKSFVAPKRHTTTAISPPEIKPFRTWLRWVYVGIGVFGIALIWASGLMDTPNPVRAYYKAEEHVRSHLPAGGVLVERDWLSKNEPWHESEYGVMCQLTVKQANPSRWTDWTVWMKRRGRWWVVDSLKQEERPMEYMTFKTADIDRRGGLFYSVNKFRIYSLDSLLNNMAYFGWEPAQSSVPGELVFRRPKNSGPYTSFSLEFEPEGKK